MKLLSDEVAGLRVAWRRIGSRLEAGGSNEKINVYGQEKLEER